jgi:hypothetical protein
MFLEKREPPIRIMWYTICSSTPIYVFGEERDSYKNYVVDYLLLHSNLFFRGKRASHKNYEVHYLLLHSNLFFRGKREPPIRIMCYLLLHSMYFSWG